MKFTINITLKKGVLDPQGLAIKNSLMTSGFQNIIEVKQGKLIEIDIDEHLFPTCDFYDLLSCLTILKTSDQIQSQLDQIRLDNTEESPYLPENLSMEINSIYQHIEHHVLSMLSPFTRNALPKTSHTHTTEPEVLSLIEDKRYESESALESDYQSQINELNLTLMSLI